VEIAISSQTAQEGLESPNNIFNLPEEKSLPGDDVPVPYYIVGDNAFGINKRLMNPFAIRNMEQGQVTAKMLAIQSTTAVWKLPSLLKLLSNGGPLFSCSWTLDHLSSKLGFDGAPGLR
jgi:hypothetical protein